MMARFAACAALLLPLLLCGCEGKDNSNSNSAEKPVRRARPGAGDSIDRMRSLPYAGEVENDADADKNGVTRYEKDRACPGYTLYSVHTQSRAELIDLEGKVLRSWSYAPSRHWDNADLLPNGDLLVIGADPSDPGIQGIMDERRYVLRFNWAGALLWKRNLPVHHDIEQTPDGRLATLSFERRNEPAVSSKLETRDDHITLLDGAGNVVESVSMFDIIKAQPEIFPLQPVKATRMGGKTWVDLFHSNAVEFMDRAKLFDKDPIYARGNVLICFRHQDRVAIFDFKNRKVLWAWGKDEIAGPHDATLLENGNILLLDNGLGRGYSRVIELDPLTRKIAWEYPAPTPQMFYTPSKGSAQRLPNGNTLICNSDSGNIFEVTPDKQVVWQFFNPHQGRKGRGTLVRAKRYDQAFIDTIEAAHQTPAASQP